MIRKNDGELLQYTAKAFCFILLLIHFQIYSQILHSGGATIYSKIETTEITDTLTIKNKDKIKVLKSALLALNGEIYNYHSDSKITINPDKVTSNNKTTKLRKKYNKPLLVIRDSLKLAVVQKIKENFILTAILFRSYSAIVNACNDIVFLGIIIIIETNKKLNYLFILTLLFSSVAFLSEKRRTSFLFCRPPPLVLD